MNKQTYRSISMIACIIAMIGLVSFVGGIRAVNLGAFFFPAIISIMTFLKYRALTK